MPKPHAVRWASHLETLLPSATRTRHTIRNHAMVIITTFGVQYVQKSSICSGVFSGRAMMCEYPQCVMAYPPHEQRQSNGKGSSPRPFHIVLYVVPQQHVAAEPGKVVEQTKGVPFTRAKTVLAHILGEVWQHGAYAPNEQEYLFFPLACPFHPRGKNGQVQVQPHKHVYVPYVAGHETEGIRYAHHVPHSVCKALAVRLCPTEYLIHHAAVHAQNSCKPRCEIIQDGPYQEGYHHTGYALAIEGTHGASYW